MPFFESRDTEVFKAVQNKLFASIEEQMDNHTLMLYMLHLYASFVCTYDHCRVFFKNTFVWLLFFDVLCRKKKKATRGTELQFLKNFFLFYLFIFNIQKAPSEVDEWKTIK